jgi:hypothetical protein
MPHARVGPIHSASWRTLLMLPSCTWQERNGHIPMLSGEHGLEVRALPCSSLHRSTLTRRGVERSGSCSGSEPEGRGFASHSRARPHVATVRKNRDPVELRPERALCYQALAELLSGCNPAPTQWVSKGPVLLSIPFPFHHNRGTGFLDSTQGQEGRWPTTHSARDAARPG